jgi:DNA helicase-2/ATP-dependent DNA helicase PcrA
VNDPRRGLGARSLASVARDAELKGRSLYESFKDGARRDPALRRKAWAGYITPLEEIRARRGGAGKGTGSFSPGSRERVLPKEDLGDLLQELMERTGFEGSVRAHGDDVRLENLAELKRGIIEFGNDPENTLEDFLDRAALYTSMDAEKSRDAVSVMTVHAAKGLEFDAVFVIGLNEGLFPSRRAESPEDMEEERRILYVAMTRARKALRLTSSERAGRDAPVRRPSRFLFETAGNLDGARPKDLELLLKPSPPGEGLGWGEAEALAARAAGPVFSRGDAVEHASFGKGEILSVNLRESSSRIRFEAHSADRDIMFGGNLRKLPEGP